MTNGTVKFFNAAKGFGFVTPEGGGKDVFVPAASVTASGIANLKPGQLVSFDTEPDSKGPKAVNLKLLADAPKPAPRPVPQHIPQQVHEHYAPPPPVQDVGFAGITLFHDPNSDASRIVLAALADAGQEPRLVDYIVAPPDRDALKALSLLLRGGDQSLVRKYDHLFQELRLDDRFISDGEFWSAIVEHPSLINGPVLANAHKARVCRTENAVRAFLGLDAVEEGCAAAKPKGIPMRAADAAPAVKVSEARKPEPKAPEKVQKLEKAPEPKIVQERAPAPKKTDATATIAVKAPVKAPVKTKPLVKAKPAAKAKPKAKVETKVKAKPKAAAKTVAKPAAKAAKKPVKPVRRGK